MNYAKADALLQGRCRKRRKVGTYTYLERRDRAIAVSIDWSDKLVFHPDGRIDVAARWVDRLKRRPRIKGFFPEPWCSCMYRKRTILYRAQDGHKKGWAVKGLVTVIPNGPICIKGRRKKLDLRPFGDVYEEVRKQDLARRRRRHHRRKLDPPLARWRQRRYYWRRKVERRGPSRGTIAAIRIDRHKRRLQQLERAGESARQRLYYWRRKVEGREPSRLTVAAILKEHNVQVRAAKIQAYGLERYFLDAGAQTVDSSGEYALLRIGLDRQHEMVCLKMVCPSTGAAYISPVPPGTRTVDQALDWMFGVTNYRENLIAES